VNYYPSFVRPTTFGTLENGVPGIRETLHHMVRLQRQWKKDPGVRELAAQLVRTLPQGDTTASVKALHAFVRDCIRYTADIDMVETLQTPRATLELGIGDCDDKSLLLASMLGAIGIRSRFIAVGFGAVERYTHVLVQVRLGSEGKWYYLETIKNVPAGWRPKGIKWQLCAHN
jgi:transglutaminase-like putative cysteine protease